MLNTLWYLLYIILRLLIYSSVFPKTSTPCEFRAHKPPRKECVLFLVLYSWRSLQGLQKHTAAEHPPDCSSATEASSFMTGWRTWSFGQFSILLNYYYSQFEIISKHKQRMSFQLASQANNHEYPRWAFAVKFLSWRRPWEARFGEQAYSRILTWSHLAHEPQSHEPQSHEQSFNILEL